MKIFIKIIIFFCFFYNLNSNQLIAEEKIKIGLLVPLSGQESNIGKSIMQSIRMAINKIDNSNIEIIPKDTQNNPEITFSKAQELKKEGVKIVIGPIFNKNLIYLDELKEMIFLSLTNKNINNPKNIISTGINANSQIRTIIKFQNLNSIERTIFLIPDLTFKEEIEKAIIETKIKLKHTHIYKTNPTLLTKQIEKITLYKQRQNNLKSEIERIKKSNDINKEKKIQKLKKRDTIGGINFDSVIIADFDENLKSIATSLLYTDISPERIYYITLNQWFDESLLKETSLQPMYFPSINKENLDKFINDYQNTYGEKPNQLSFLSYDLIGLVYHIIYQNNFKVSEKIFYKKNRFKGKIGIFEINKNKINHILNFYKIEDQKFKKIF